MSTRSTASETVTVYGIKSCDTMKKAINWLTEQGIPFELHDYKKVGVEAERLKSWLVTAGPDKVINRRGTTWRALSDADKAACESPDPDAIAEILAANTSAIKRPIVTAESLDTPLVGFNSAEWVTAFK